MGLIDTIRCQATAPGSELLGDREFQTKGLGCRFDTFTINPAGRLIHHRTQVNGRSIPFKTVLDIDVIAPIHRDLRLTGDDGSGNLCDFVARFTDGRLEWVKPWDAFTEVEQEYLVAGES
jgi:hypothetical protein